MHQYDSAIEELFDTIEATFAKNKIIEDPDLTSDKFEFMNHIKSGQHIYGTKFCTGTRIVEEEMSTPIYKIVMHREKRLLYLPIDVECTDSHTKGKRTAKWYWHSYMLMKETREAFGAKKGLYIDLPALTQYCGNSIISLHGDDAVNFISPLLADFPTIVFASEDFTATVVAKLATIR